MLQFLKKLLNFSTICLNILLEINDIRVHSFDLFVFSIRV